MSVLGPEKPSSPRPSRRPKAWESFRGQNSGINPWELTSIVTRIYQTSSSVEEFTAALGEHGCELVKGTRSEWCIRDSAGHLHSLGRRIRGVPAAQLLEFFADMTTT